MIQLVGRQQRLYKSTLTLQFGCCHALGKHINPFPNDSTKQIEFVDDNFRFDENRGKFSEQVEKHQDKGEIGLCKQSLFFQ